jgi:PEP-CTERM/exosortase A-associated glycosyltransferase
VSAAIRRLQRRVRAAATEVLLASPLLVRGSGVAGAVQRELVRRLDRPSSERARQLWARQLRSVNSTASRTAAAAAAAVRQPAPLLQEMERLAAARPDDLALRLDLCAVLRRAGMPERAAMMLATTHEVGATQVPLLLREAIALAGRDGAGALLREVTPRDAAAAERLQGVLLVTEQIAGRRVDEIAREHPADPSVLEAAARCADGLGEERGVAEVALQGTAATVGTLTALATSLEERGDLRLSTRLARRVIERSPGAAEMRRIATRGGARLAMLERGWQPPPRSESPAEPSDARRVHYLLHSSLPYTSLGYATRTQGLLHALRGQGWDVRGVTQPGYPETVISPARRDDVDGVPYVRLPMAGALPHWPVESMVEAYRSALTPLVATERPAILHAASNFRNGFAAVDVARRRGIRSIYEVRGLWQYTRLAREPEFDQTESFALLERLEAQAASLADRCVVITRALGDHMVGLGVPEERISVVPNGVDTERFQPREKDAALASELGLEGRTVIGYVGGLVEYEGLDLLVESAHILCRDRHDVRVLVVGDGRSLPDLRAAVADRGIGDSIVFTGHVPHEEVERYYSLIDIAPFPRLPVKVSELVSPLKPFEAMAMGKAVVASDVAALAEIIDDGVTGRLFDKGSAASLARVLRDLLENDEHRAELATQGLRWVRRERDWSSLASRVSDLYTELTDPSGSRGA